MVEIKEAPKDVEPEDIKKGDFIYFDPPYQPVSKTANFTSYTNRMFTDDDLERLANLAEKLDSMGCKVLLSNSKSKIVEYTFSSSKWKKALSRYCWKLR